MRVEGCVLVLLDGWMVVRFVGVTRVPLCARVSCVRPVCVPAPPGVFLPVAATGIDLTCLLLVFTIAERWRQWRRPSLPILL